MSIVSIADIIEIREEIALPNDDYKKYISVQFRGGLETPLFRVHTKTLPPQTKYRLMLKQIEGFQTSIRILFIEEVLKQVQ